MTRFVRTLDPRSLSVRDVLEAREAYHSHLANMQNVVGTAIGLYRFRRDRDRSLRQALSSQEDALDSALADGGDVPAEVEPKRFDNTVVRRWSYPCVLVFVDNWMTRAELSQRPQDLVPPRLYLPDGRLIPTCVLHSPRVHRRAEPLESLEFPSGLMGGGYPVLTSEQSQERVGSLGCLVTNGHRVFGLTNAHVVGNDGAPIYTVLRGDRQQIGTAHSQRLTKIPFDRAYPRWPGERSVLAADAGLVDIGDLRLWTAQVYGIGEVGDPLDLNIDTISFDLIGCPVRSFGGATGVMKGTIDGLFYRYRSIGGFDYVADFLISPREVPEGEDGAGLTRPGDSGTVWFWDPSAERTQPASPGPPRPLALQWGGHLFTGNGDSTVLPFALATNLATVCRLLDVELVRDWDTGHSTYWGKVGHFKVAAAAIGLVLSSGLQTILAANAARISVSDPDLDAGRLPMASRQSFVPLADVADLVWRTTRKKDSANHFADMDQEGKGKFQGKTLLELWKKDKKALRPKVWNEFYEALDIDRGHRGALPFRVWEMYAEMVKALQAKDVGRFVCTAGLMAHYVGDACQPLHVSHLHHGHDKSEEAVHAAYETRMLDRFRREVVVQLNAVLKDKTAATFVQGGEEAAQHMAALMSSTIERLPPTEVIDVFNKHSGSERTARMWDELGARTIACMGAGAKALAELWESAWREGGGQKLPKSKLGAIPEASLMTLYLDPAFLPARRLHEMFLNA